MELFSYKEVADIQINHDNRPKYIVTIEYSTLIREKTILSFHSILHSSLHHKSTSINFSRS